jgi:hypothetical protein
MSAVPSIGLETPVATLTVKDLVELLVPLVVERIKERERKLKLSERQAALIVVGALEEDLGLARTVTPRHKRQPS